MCSPSSICSMHQVSFISSSNRKTGFPIDIYSPFWVDGFDKHPRTYQNLQIYCHYYRWRDNIESFVSVGSVNSQTFSLVLMISFIAICFFGSFSRFSFLISIHLRWSIYYRSIGDLNIARCGVQYQCSRILRIFDLRLFRLLSFHTFCI